MKITSCIGAVAIFTLFSSSASHAQKPEYGSGNYMLKHCQHFLQENYRYDPFDGECSGIVSTAMFFGKSLPPDFRFCVPESASLGQAIRIVIKYMESNPQLLHLDLRGLATTALHEAWPCKR
ncbi:MAG: hypothetical protein J0G36_22035 [Afipia sp.]|nr:hypothetical protein [Afipia sp.]